MTDKPSDAEIIMLAVESGVSVRTGKGAVKLARAVLEKWGQPAVAGEPDFYTACAWHEGGGVGEWIALPGYSNETEHGVKHLVLEAARNEGYKGTAAGRLLELGWEIRPVFLTPQPTQAQAGAVPDEQLIQQMLNALRTCRVELPGTRFKSASYDESAVSVAITAAEVRAQDAATHAARKQGEKQ